jgi:CRP/FNR family transcriptional regulator, cyclic AMP receptor protein
MAQQDPFSRYKKKFQRGTVLYKEGDRAEEFFIIQSGFVKLQKVVENRLIILAILEKGEFFGDDGVFEKALRYTAAVVLNDSEIIVIPVYDFEMMVMKNIEIGIRLIKKYCTRLQGAYQHLVTTLPEDEKGRVLKVLVWLMSRFGVLKDGKTFLNVPMTPEDISGIAGATMETTQKMLADLSSGGMIGIVDGRIIMVNREKLFKFIEYFRWRKTVQTSGT